MKKIIFALIISNIFANSLYLENCKINSLNLSKIPKKYYHQLYIKAPFDKNAHHYIGITLKDFKQLIGAQKEITFIAYDDYKVTFGIKEINAPYIFFVFLEDNSTIPLSKRGPAKIIYTKKDKNKNYIFKSIFLIKKAVCE